MKTLLITALLLFSTSSLAVQTTYKKNSWNNDYRYSKTNGVSGTVKQNSWNKGFRINEYNPNTRKHTSTNCKKNSWNNDYTCNSY